jgi:hypothetical protein
VRHCGGKEEVPAEGKQRWKIKAKRHQDKEEVRRTDGIFQGLMRNFRKLQGPICKTKFSVDLEP